MKDRRRNSLGLPMYWLCRIYVCLCICSTCYIALTSQGEHHWTFVEGGATQLGILLLGFLAVVGIVDVIVNDLLPAEWCKFCAWVHIPLNARHFVYFAMATGQLTLLYIRVVHQDLDSVIVVYIRDALMAILVGVLDVLSRAGKQRND